MGGSRKTIDTGDGDSQGEAWRRSSEYSDEHGQSRIDILEPRPTGGSREAIYAGDGDQSLPEAFKQHF
jgi:hypothetical protein